MLDAHDAAIEAAAQYIHGEICPRSHACDGRCHALAQGAEPFLVAPLQTQLDTVRDMVTGFYGLVAVDDTPIKALNRIADFLGCDRIIGGAHAWTWCEDPNCPMQAEGQHVH